MMSDDSLYCLVCVFFMTLPSSNKCLEESGKETSKSKTLASRTENELEAAHLECLRLP